MTSEIEPEDGELIRRARAGDESAFQALFDRYLARFERLTADRIPPALRAKVSVLDVMQEARIVAFRRLPDFEDRGPGSFGAWLRKIVETKVHEAVRHYRNVAKRDIAREVPREARTRTGNLAGQSPTPSQWAMAAELREAAERALMQLPAEHREVLRLVREEQLPLRAVAERMGRSVDAVKKLSARALAKFAEALAKERGD
ncbi:MAG: sigma-70 family RNA polymerase sigma factor [Planctomycetota bacterium]